MRLSIIARAGIVATVLWTLTAGLALGSWRQAEGARIADEAIAACKNAALERREADMPLAIMTCHILLDRPRSSERKRTEWFAAFTTAAAIAAGVWLLSLAMFPVWQWVAAGRTNSEAE